MSEGPALWCPNCGRGLGAPDGARVCDCEVPWRESEGVLWSPYFDRDRYWGEIDRESMRAVLARVRDLGAEQALTRWAREQFKSYLEDYAFDWRRALCLELIDLPAAPVVLDYGCGFGTLGLAAAGAANRVYLVDGVAERIEFAAALASERSLDNVVPIGAQTWDALPIPPASLDLVLINGVLEWVAVNRGGPALEVQRSFLAKMASLLKPGGTLFIGIENRFALRYLIGYPDDHSGLRYTSLLPRWSVQAYTRLRGRGPYRTITWSLREHHRRLAALGLAVRDVYCLYPDYRFPQVACRLSDGSLLARLHSRSGRGSFKRLVEGLIRGFAAWPYLVYSFGVVAVKRAS